MHVGKLFYIEHTQWLFIVLYININNHLRTGMSKKINIYIIFLFILIFI